MKPFLKWVGGKTQILEDVLSLFPTRMNQYHEPFLGGGSVLLGFLSRVKEGSIVVEGNIYASDINPNLIALYKHIQTQPQVIIDEVNKLTSEFAQCKGTEINRKATSYEEAKSSPESYYFWIRSRFNREEKSTATSSAMFLFLNKTCFRGVYREGPHGFNVPFGNYKNPTILEEERIRSISELVKNVIFTTCSFTESLQKVKANDFVYLDPPYAPETSTSFVSYTSDGFGIEQHTALFKLCKESNAKIVMSNADVPLVKEAFPSPVYTTKSISCRRAINSKNPETRTNEVLITN